MAITVTGGPAYGLAWNKTTDAYTRVASAAGLTAGTAFNSLSGGAWGLRRVNLWDDGTPTAYYGDRCYTDTDVANMGQAMVQIPTFYYYMEYNGATTTYYWFVTTTAATTIDVGLGVGAQAVKIHPAFTRDTATRANIYLGAYEGYFNTTTSMLESKSGVAPTGSKTLAQFRTAARLRAGAVANKWEQQDYLTTCAVQLLYLIEYATFRSQATLGGGLAGAITLQNTGLTTAYGNASYGVTADKLHAMSYRGLENLYGNIWKFLDGINIKSSYDPWIANHDFVVDTYAHPYVNSTATPLLNADGYITDIKVDTTYDYGFLPATGGGSTATFLSDYYVRATGNRIVVYGGNVTDNESAGAFNVYAHNASTASGVANGARLMYVG